MKLVSATTASPGAVAKGKATQAPASSAATVSLSDGAGAAVESSDESDDDDDKFNPRSLYDIGRSCKWCGSVEHFTKDCPTRQLQMSKNKMCLPVADFGRSADADDDVIPTAQGFGSARESKKTFQKSSGPGGKPLHRRKVVTF